MLIADKARRDEFRLHPPMDARRVTSRHPGMSLRTQFQPGMLIVQVRGAIEACSAARLSDQITDLANPDRPVILDLRGVNFINDDGFYALVRFAEASRRTGMRWALVTGEAVDRLLSVTPNTDRLPIADSVDEAMQRLPSHHPASSQPHRSVTTARELTRR